jgi:gas vesicle protein
MAANTVSNMSNTGSNAGTFLLGLGIGATIAILFAPKSGRVTRRYIEKRMKEGKQVAQDMADQIRKDAANLIDRGEKTVSREVDRVYYAFDAGREAYWQSRGDGSTTNS